MTGSRCRVFVAAGHSAIAIRGRNERASLVTTIALRRSMSVDPAWRGTRTGRASREGFHWMGVLNDRMTPPTEVHRDVMRDAGSRENIELVREHVEAYVRRDVEAMRRLSSADLELDWSASKGWLADVYRGIEEVMRFYADYYAHFDEI